jgi:outer membrane protein TolC
VNMNSNINSYGVQKRNAENAFRAALGIGSAEEVDAAFLLASQRVPKQDLQRVLKQPRKQRADYGKRRQRYNTFIPQGKAKYFCI